MMEAIVAGRIAGISQSEHTEKNGAVLRFTVFARPYGVPRDVPVVCTVMGSQADAIMDSLDTNCFVTCTGGVVPALHPDGNLHLAMSVSKVKLQGFAVEGEMMQPDTD